MNIYKIPKISFNKYLINISSRERDKNNIDIVILMLQMSIKKHSFMPIDIKIKLAMDE
jgi:hypothetical protein